MGLTSGEGMCVSEKSYLLAQASCNSWKTVI
jgi:hypothetical protein